MPNNISLTCQSDVASAISELCSLPPEEGYRPGVIGALNPRTFVARSPSLYSSRSPAGSRSPVCHPPSPHHLFLDTHIPSMSFQVFNQLPSLLRSGTNTNYLIAWGYFFTHKKENDNYDQNWLKKGVGPLNSYFFKFSLKYMVIS